MTSRHLEANDLLEFEVRVLRRAERSVKVERTQLTRRAAWLPLSRIELHANEGGGTHQLFVPEWLAAKEGLIG